jgi:hypothetical protein
MKEEDRFEQFIIRDPNSGCWFFMGADDNNGYGGFRRSKEKGGKWTKAHKVSYDLFVGKVPEGKILDHLCRVRCCVNPEHLEPVTYKENADRGLTGINMSSKTHCPQGHPYRGDNLYIKPNGGRDCKTCRKEANRRCRENRN